MSVSPKLYLITILALFCTSLLSQQPTEVLDPAVFHSVDIYHQKEDSIQLISEKEFELMLRKAYDHDTSTKFDHYLVHLKMEGEADSYFIRSVPILPNCSSIAVLLQKEYISDKGFMYVIKD